MASDQETKPNGTQGLIKERGQEEGQLEKLQTFEEFWPFYLQQHSKSNTRLVHYIGTTLTFVALGYAIYSGVLWNLLWVPVAGYSFAWFGHFFIEKNRPATFTYPLWSLFSDYKMYFLFILGRLGPELKRAKVN